MKKIVISERQERELVRLLNEEAYQMPVDKKVSKPYCINPEKVLIVKKFLDSHFSPKDYEKIGVSGLPTKIRIVSLNASNGEPLKLMYMEQLHDMLIDHFQNMFSDHDERSLFLKQVMNDWFDGKIGVHGTLSVNRLYEGQLNEITSDEITAEANKADRNPTDGQKEAGNYKMGHISVKGMPISIENPSGSYRKYKNEDGSDGKIMIRNHYGYFTNTTGNGKDGDAVDVFLGPDVEDFERVYVVDQFVDGKFDESKVMVGFSSKDEAKAAYFSNYNDEWKGFKYITGVSLDVFKKWLYRGNKQRKPFAHYVAIKRRKLEEGTVNEEEYNVVKTIAAGLDDAKAKGLSNLISNRGIDSWSDDGNVYIIVEKDMMDDGYVEDIVKRCRALARQYLSANAAHSSVMTEEVGREPLLCSIVLDDESRMKLRSLLKRYGNDFKVFCHHSTLAYKPDSTYLKYCKEHEGEKVSIIGTHIGESDKCIALKVDYDVPSTNRIKHITMAVKDGGKPVDSNYIENWEKLKTPIELSGTIAIDYKK